MDLQEKVSLTEKAGAERRKQRLRGESRELRKESKELREESRG